MAEYKLVKEESFESISKYLNLIYGLTDISNPLAFVNVDNKKYMITKVDDEYAPDESKYAICYDEGNNIRLVGSFYDDNSFALNLGDIAYRFDNDGAVVLEDQNNGYKQQLSCNPTIESNPKVSFNYSQIDPCNKRSLYLHYVVNGYNDPNVALPYLKNKNANEVTYLHGILSMRRSHALNDKYYYRYVRYNDDTIILLPIVKHYTTEELMDYYQSLGFNPGVTDEMVELYTNRNKKVKTLKKVTDEYRKNTGI